MPCIHQTVARVPGKRGSAPRGVSGDLHDDTARLGGRQVRRPNLGPARTGLFSWRKNEGWLVCGMGGRIRGAEHYWEDSVVVTYLTVQYSSYHLGRPETRRSEPIIVA